MQSGVVANIGEMTTTLADFKMEDFSDEEEEIAYSPDVEETKPLHNKNKANGGGSGQFLHNGSANSNLNGSAHRYRSRLEGLNREKERMEQAQKKRSSPPKIKGIKSVARTTSAGRDENDHLHHQQQQQGTHIKTTAAVKPRKKAPAHLHDYDDGDEDPLHMRISYHTGDYSICTASREDDPAETDSDEEFGGDEMDLEQSQKNQQGEEEEWHNPFSESTYTFLYMCGPRSQAFWYALLVYFFQVSTIVLTLIYIIDWQSDENPIQLPPMVDLTVTLTQWFCVFIMLAFQQDLIEAVAKLHDGYYPEVEEKHKGATYCSWLTSCIAQLIAGILLLATIFILTMQVHDVLSIMLNFAALHFVAEIDDLGFSLAKMGFVTTTLQDSANDCADFKVPVRSNVQRDILTFSFKIGETQVIPKRNNLLRRWLYIGTLITLMTGFSVLKQQQFEGKYIETYLFVQFGDEYNPKLQYYTGLFESEDTRTHTHRRYRDMRTKEILFTYCKSEKSWTFSDTNDPCDFFAKSPQTNSYDATTIPREGWEVRDYQYTLQPFVSFTLVGADCDPDRCKGECVQELCECPPDRFGWNCEFGDICPELVIDGTGNHFPPLKRHGLSLDLGHSFRPLVDETGNLVKNHNFPVYYSETRVLSTFIFFGGRRWVMTHEIFHIPDYECGGNFDLDCVISLQDKSFIANRTAEILKTHKHNEAVYEPMFLSDPVDYRTPAYQPTPLGLGWYQAATLDETLDLIGAASPINTMLSCKSCLPIYGGFCVSGSCNMTTTFCDCDKGYSGPRCEIEQRCYEQEWPCFGRGLCDPWTGVCRCFQPHYGNHCDQVYDCSDERGKCLNGGTCNGYGTCDCVDPATSGLACELQHDCAIFGCNNGGVCEKETGKCDCPSPYYGFGCDLMKSIVVEAPHCIQDEDCVNGICNLDTGACTCSNPTSYGTFCENEFNCTNEGCKHKGICHDRTGLCECKPPHVGLDCSEIPDCKDDKDCFGPGTCLKEDLLVAGKRAGSCLCDNFPLEAGKLCEMSFDCRKVGCLNSGKCNDDGFCDCVLPYRGPSCELVLSDEAQ